MACIALTANCDSSGNLFKPLNSTLIDPSMDLKRDDYEHVTDIKPAGKDGETDAAGGSEPPVPDLAEILAAPRPPKLGETKLVSVAVTDDVPLKDVLIELARLAEVDIEVDSSITGGISFRAKDRPFNEVIERIADLAALRYTFKNNVLRVERDTPYVQIYSLDFLNVERNSTNKSSVDTGILTTGGSSSGGGSGGAGGSSGGSSSGGGGNNSSSSSLDSKSDSDFWKQFEGSIKQILGYSASKRISSADISAQPVTPASAAATGAVPVVAPAPAPAPAPAANPADAGKLAEGAFYGINRQASILTISATEKQHELVREFLRRIQANVSSQVLIEAKIVEVTLNNEFQSGINWTKLGNNKISFAGNLTSPAASPLTNQATIDIGKPHQLAFTNQIDLSAAVQLIESFGTTRTLSSPRLHATNNQQAILTFTQNFVYFNVQITNTPPVISNGVVITPSQTTVNSTLHTTPIGIILALQPSINLDTSEVTMSIRPTLSRITGTVNDPGAEFSLALLAQQGVDITGIPPNPTPIVEVRELDSILKLKSGQVMVIGGLMQDIADNTDKGVPGASSIPFIGSLFKGVDKQHQLSELVIFIRATIVDSNGDAAGADKSLYRKFTKDPRPLGF